MLARLVTNYSPLNVFLKRHAKTVHEASAAAEGSMRTDHTCNCNGCGGSLCNVGSLNKHDKVVAANTCADIVRKLTLQ